MPAPLAKGLIISISIILAAGLAVYENPQVRQWVDESRRKIAIALHSLGDEIQPNRNRSEERQHREDASTREDDSPEAVERRRIARQEILERGRAMEEKRRAKTGDKAIVRSFDDLVDEKGQLKREAEEAEARTTAVENANKEEGLRKRTTEKEAVAMGAAMADPFADEMHMDFQAQDSSLPAPHSAAVIQPCTSTTSLPGSLHSPVLVNTDTISTHPSELLVDLTPTTSTSSAHNDLSELANGTPQQLEYFSVNEWAENSAASFYSPPESEGGAQELVRNLTDDDANGAISEAGTGERIENESDIDIVSEMGESIHTPSSWTEVGSVVSEDD